MRRDTVGGGNPANQLIDMENIQLYSLKGFIHSRWLFGISEPSTLCCCTFLPVVCMYSMPGTLNKQSLRWMFGETSIEISHIQLEIWPGSWNIQHHPKGKMWYIYIYIGCRQPKYLLAEIQFFPHSNCRSPAASPKQRAPKAQAAPEEKVQGPHTSGNVVWGGVLG